MKKLRKIKFYIHHRKYFSVGFESRQVPVKILAKIINGFFAFFYYIGLGILNLFSFFKNTFIAACFHTGSLLINSVVKSFLTIKNDFKKTRLSLPKRFKILFQAQFIRSLILFLVVAGAASLGLGSLHLIAKGLEIKDKIMHTATVGNFYLSEAKNALASQDFSQAENRFAQAFQTFSQGQADLAQSGQALNQLLSLIPQKKDADRLLSAAGLVAQSGQDFINLEKQVKTLKLGPAGISATDRPTAEVFKSISDGLYTAVNKLRLANSIVDKVDANNLPPANRANFLDLKSKLSTAQSALGNFSEIFGLVKNLASGDKNILLVFENNNELRAGGGFIGTYGAVLLKDGGISKIKVSSIYDLDGQLTESIKPPEPVLNLSSKWFLRDSNWFASWPFSAKKITDFYEKEGGETPDIVIALTPNLIIDWLKITGPINLPNYNVTLDAENFVEKTQVASTQSYDLPTNSPKQILADLVPVLLQKISALSPEQWPALIRSFQDSLNGKQLVIYSRDPDTQSQLEALNWAGKISSADRDYLSVVSSNLGGTKTDLSIDQQISLNSTVEADGSIIDELTITRTNPLPQLDKTGNLSFLRVYAPKGSTLLSNIGFDFKTLSYPDGEKYKIDPDVYNLEKNSLKDVVTGTTIGVEDDKTFFGNWLEVVGGQTKTVKLTYRLPFKVGDVDHYSLLLQKQIGAKEQKLSWNFNFAGFKIVWKNFDPTRLDTDSLNSDILLDKDYFLGMVLQKR